MQQTDTQKWGLRQKQDHGQRSQDDGQAGWGVLFSSGRRTPLEGWEAMDAEALEQRRHVLNQIIQHLRSTYLGLRVLVNMQLTNTLHSLTHPLPCFSMTDREKPWTGEAFMGWKAGMVPAQAEGRSCHLRSSPVHLSALL